MFMLEGSMLVGLGCPAEGADAGGSRFFHGSLRRGPTALRRFELLAGCVQGRLVLLALRLQLVNPGVDSLKALPLRGGPPGVQARCPRS